MERKKVFLITQSLLCALVAGLLAGIALYLYLDGAAKQAAGDMFYYSFTREKVGKALLFVLPVFLVSLGLTVAGLILAGEVIKDLCGIPLPLHPPTPEEVYGLLRNGKIL